jgi:hypothetical protein
MVMTSVNDDTKIGENLLVVDNYQSRKEKR